MARINRKTLYKTITYRILSIVLSLVLSYIFLGSIKDATAFTLIYAGLSTLLYYYHEKFYKWLRRKGKI